MAIPDDPPTTPDHRVWVQGQPVSDYPRLPPEATRGTVRRITVVGEDVLHRRCQPVTEFGTDELATLIDDMFATMYAAEGVGLAANQVGVDLQLFVYDCADEQGVRHVGHIANPALDDLPAPDRTLEDGSEGCLSVPGPYRTVSRPDRAVVRGVDQHGAPMVLEGTGYFARCLQHETDHLFGRLYIDRLAAKERRSALREMAEQQEQIFTRRARRADNLRRAADAHAADAED